MNKIIIFTAASVMLASAFVARAQDEKLTIEPREKWSNVLAETKVHFHFQVKAPAAFKGRAEWTFSDPGSKRVLPRGRGETPLAANDDKREVKVPLEIPPVNPGVILQTQLSVSVFADGKDKPEAVLEKTVWIFPADPFNDRSKWLKDLKITLYDPDPKGKTADVLKALKVPFEEQRNVAALGELKEGVLLIGEGVSFKDDAGLGDILVQAAGRGVPVLCLAPSAGNIPLPGADNALPSPDNVILARRDTITKLDKRFDAQGWAPDNQVVASSLAVKTDDGRVVAEVVEGAKGWPWLQADFTDKKGRLLVCGFSLVAKWDASATPRYLFARLLERVTELQDSEAIK
jgi:hypothetical protein